MMAHRRMICLISYALGVLGVLIYLIAKIHFFMHYEPLALENYIREHNVYWVVMAVIALLICIIERLFPEKYD